MNHSQTLEFEKWFDTAKQRTSVMRDDKEFVGATYVHTTTEEKVVITEGMIITLTKDNEHISGWSVERGYVVLFLDDESTHDDAIDRQQELGFCLNGEEVF